METIDTTQTAPARRSRRKATDPKPAKAPAKAKQQQAEAPAAPAPKRQRKDRQQQNAGPKDSAGAGTSGKGTGPAQQPGADAGKQGDTTISTVLRGGTKQVLIEVVEAQTRGAPPPETEEYPFGLLSPAEITKDDAGEKIVGPSFFIPEADNPKIKVATARKRHKGVTFITRKAVLMKDDAGKDLDHPIEGRRVWKAPAGYQPSKGD